ncbi:MAG: RnfABCDGE type electron transport complex subunit D, partial [Clostridia bacterium]
MSEYNSLVSLEQESYISAYKKMQKVLIALLSIYFLNVFYYGFITIINATVACALCFIIDNICYKIQKKSRQKGDISSLITGLIFVLLLPANIPLYILIIGCFVAICVAKAPFGGFGKNIFNPAAVAFCFVAISFKSQVLMYPDTFSQGGIGGIESAKMVQGISATLTINSSPNIGMFDVVLGRFAGPLAVTSVILLLACGLFLIITKTINWKIPFITILTCSAFAFIFPRASVSQFQSVFYELTSGLIVFGSIFMATDPVLVPKKSTSQILYAFVLGITT